MKIDIQSIHFSARDTLRELLKQRIEKLTTFYSPIMSAKVILQLESSGAVDNKCVEIELQVPGTKPFAEARAESFEKATTLAVESLRRQLRKLKGKQIP